MSTVSKIDRDASDRIIAIREAVNLLFADACGDKAGHMLALRASVKAGKVRVVRDASATRHAMHAARQA